jgi:hypothetical protein
MIAPGHVFRRPPLPGYVPILFLKPKAVIASHFGMIAKVLRPGVLVSAIVQTLTSADIFREVAPRLQVDHADKALSAASRANVFP